MKTHRFFLCALIPLCLSCQSNQNVPVRTGESKANARTDPVVQSTPSAANYSVPDALASADKLFLDVYKQRQAAVKSNTSPVIVANFSSLILYRKGTSETNRSIPHIYHALKCVDHIPFGIFLCVYLEAGDGEKPLGEKALGDLRTFKESIVQVEKVLPEAGFSLSQIERQQKILQECKAYLTGVLDAGKAPRNDLLAFARRVGPMMLSNADEAAMAQLDMTHAVVMQWKKRIPSDEWKNLTVIVRGLQMPRRKNIMTQYFAKLLGEPSHNLGYPLESRHLIYAEFISKERDHLDLMATTFIDGDASEAFFGDRWRMSRDVLADGTEEYLKKLNFEEN